MKVLVTPTMESSKCCVKMKLKIIHSVHHLIVESHEEVDLGETAVKSRNLE